MNVATLVCRCLAVQAALTEQDKAEGYILACQARIHGEVKSGCVRES